jgi:hypothetical protein
MAGPYKLKPGQTQKSIPTWESPRQTDVCVTNHSDKPGRISMTAGGSATEFDDIPVGTIHLSRNFGGVYLAVKNEGQVDLSVETK